MSVALVNLKTAQEWVEDGRPVAVATLIETEGSSPLEVGAMMLVDGDDNIEGSVTGGCVEGALVEEAHQVLTGGESRVRTYGISDELAAGVGLMCGGTVHVFIEALGEESREVLGTALEAAAERRPAAIATLIDGEAAGSRLGMVEDRAIGSLGLDFLDKTVTRDIRGMLENGITGLRRYRADGAAMGSDLRVSVRSFAEPPRMIIFGAIDFSAATAALAGQLGYRVAIVDPREPFLRSQRFSSVAEVEVDWPNRYLEKQELTARDVVLVFSHDAKLDEPALISGLRSGAGYVGALGSRRTQAQRAERLLEAGVSQEEIDRIAAPCGLDIGARTPPETAVSILGEVIAKQNARTGEPLSTSETPIHARREVAPSWAGMVSRAEQVQHDLIKHSYLADLGLATVLSIATTLRKPLLLEGEAGVGKTQLAKTLADMTGVRLIRLQCYEGIDVAHSLYDWNYARQMLYIRTLEAGHAAEAGRVDELFSREFLVRRPLLEAIEHDDPEPPVLLIDEIDRADDEFEAFLLELLSDFQVTIPEIGTIRAERRPTVIMTSNRTRELHDALKRRCLYHWIDHPSPEREAAIVRARVDGASEPLARHAASFVASLREMDLSRTPGVAETIDWVESLAALEERELTPTSVEATLGAVLKEREDLELVRASDLASLVAAATADGN